MRDNSRTVANHARRFHRGRWSFLGPGSEKKWYRTCSDKLDGVWDRTGEQMMKKRSKTQVAAWSDFRSEAMLWIKEVEMVDSLEESKSS